MSDTITASGNTRETFAISTSDLTINGDFTADEIFGSGKNITNISIDNIVIGTLNKPLSKSLGGTGNNIYTDNGIVFNDVTSDNNKLNTTYKLKWDKSINALLINERDFIVDNSNYVIYSSNQLINDIKESSNIISTNIKSYIINNLATPSNPGVVKIGTGLFVNNSGVISIFPENINIIPPVIIPYMNAEQIFDTEYKKLIFTYNPMRGTTFDTEKLIDDTLIIGKILPLWYNFNNNSDKSINSGNLGNSEVNSIVLNGDTVNNAIYKPLNKKDLHFEYTPLNSNYLYLNGNNNTYASFKENMLIEKIYGEGGIGGETEGITICFWFKIEDVDNSSIKKSILYFSSEGNNPNYFIDINVIGNLFTVSLFNVGGIFFSINDENLCNNTWKHFCWSISATGLWNIYIDGDEKIRNVNIDENINIVNSIGDSLSTAIIKIDSENANYINKYIGKSSILNDSYLKFSISDIRFYNRELIDYEIIELYNADKNTEYNIEFKDNNNTKCDILLIGGGGGGNHNGGGSSGELKYINNVTIGINQYVIKVARGGKGGNVGNNTFFDSIISRGGSTGSVQNNVSISSSTISNESIFYNNITTKKNNGYIGGGGGGSGTAGTLSSGGEGIYSINENEIFVNFKTLFDLPTNNSIGEYNSNDDNVYFGGGGSIIMNNGIGGIGGGGYGSVLYSEIIKYHGTNGSGGGGYGTSYAFGGDGIIILRFLNTIIPVMSITDYILDTSNIISYNLNTLSNNTDDEFLHSSNYTLDTSNIISDNLNTLSNNTDDEFLHTSNYILDTSNIISYNLNTLSNNTDDEFLHTSNYILDTSNIISDRLNTMFISIRDLGINHNTLQELFINLRTRVEELENNTPNTS